MLCCQLDGALAPTEDIHSWCKYYDKLVRCDLNISRGCKTKILH